MRSASGSGCGSVCGSSKVVLTAVISTPAFPEPEVVVCRTISHANKVSVPCEVIMHVYIMYNSSPPQLVMDTKINKIVLLKEDTLAVHTY